MTELSLREIEVLRHAAYGGKTTARMLGIAPRTVIVHWTNIYRKLEIEGNHSKKVAAIVAAVKQGVIEVSDLHPGDLRA